MLERELDEQILADGGHFERSPMYHSMILEDCLDLLNVIHAHDESQLCHAQCCDAAIYRGLSQFDAGYGGIPGDGLPGHGADAHPVTLIHSIGIVLPVRGRCRSGRAPGGPSRG